MKKMLAFILSVAMTASFAVMPISAEEVIDATFYDDCYTDINGDMSKFTDSELDGYIPQRYSANNVWIPNPNNKDILINGYVSDNTGYISYRVSEKTMLSVETYMRNDMTGNSFEISFSKNAVDWTTAQANEIDLGTMTNKDGFVFNHKTLNVIVPEGMMYAKITINKVNGDAWNMGVMSVAAKSLDFDATFYDDCYTNITGDMSKFTNSELDGYIPQRYSANNVWLVNNEGTDINGYTSDDTGSLAYYVAENTMLSVETFMSEKMKESNFEISFSRDAVDWTAVKAWEIDLGTMLKEADGHVYNHKSLNAVVPAGMRYAKITINQVDGDAWNMGVMSVSTDVINFEDMLKTAPESFTDRTDADYVPARVKLEYISSIGGGALGGYGHTYGNAEVEPALLYRVCPGRTFSIVAYNVIKTTEGVNVYDKAPTLLFSSDGINFTDSARVYPVELENIVNGNNTFAQKRYYATVPEGAYLVKVVIPAMDTDTDNWKFGISRITLNNDEIPRAEYEIGEASAAEVKNNVNVLGDIIKNSGDPETITVYFASYDETGRLVGIDMYSQEMKADDEDAKILSYDMIISRAATYKLFVWGDNMDAITDVIPVKP